MVPHRLVLVTTMSTLRLPRFAQLAAGAPSHACPAMQVRNTGGTVSQPIALTLIT